MGFLDFLAGAFGGLSSFLNSIVQFLISLVNILVQVLNAIVQALRTVFAWALTALKSLGRFLKHVWDVGIKGVLSKLVSWVRTAQKWLEDHLRPLLQFLQKMRAYLDRIYRMYIRPYLLFLQRLRRWLALLKLLHLKFAAQLDARILKTERALSGNFLRVRTVLNDIIGLVNAVSHAGRLSRMVAVAIFGRRTAAAAVRAVTGLPIGFFFPNPSKSALPFEKPVTRSSQLDSPVTNPSVASLLGGLLDLPDSGFTDTDPTPGDAELDAIETVPYFDQFRDAMLAAELFDDLTPDLHVSILEAVQQQSGPLVAAAKILTSKVNK